MNQTRKSHGWNIGSEKVAVSEPNERLPQRPRATLVVIDMQYGFEASRNPDTIAAVEREIKINVQNGWPVVLLECKPETFGRTYPVLRQHLPEDSPLVVRTRKEHNDGSKHVYQSCFAMGFSTDMLRVCGVNTTQCVQETVLGLSLLLPRSCIEVVKDACNDWSENNFDTMLNCANVVLRDGDEIRVL